MPRLVPYFFSLLIAGVLVGGPAACEYYRQLNVRNFHEVKTDVLYRSGQLSLAGLQSIIHDYGIKTVITLRDSAYPDQPPPDLAEEEYCANAGIRHIRISPRVWWSADGSIPAEEGVRRFRAIMENAKNYPVLIHCFGGIHRTGAFCAIYRMEYDHWTNAEAIAELRACGYRDLDDEWDLLGYLETYQPTWQGSGAAVGDGNNTGEGAPTSKTQTE
jgi:protein tyrosine/serine phosphatase